MMVLMRTISTTAETTFPRTLNTWLKTEDKALQAAIVAGHTVFEAADSLQREPVSVLRRLDALDQLVFDCGTEEWVEVMSLALSGVPLREVIDWCMATEERMPFDLIDAMRSSPDLRAEFELARELQILVPFATMVPDLTWLAAQPQAVQAGYAAAAGQVLARFDVLTPATLKAQASGHVALERPVAWVAPGAAPAGRGKGRKAPPSTTSGTKPRKTSTSTARGRGRRKSSGVKNKWALANWKKSQAAKARAWA